MLHAALAGRDRGDVLPVSGGDLSDEAAEDDRNSLVREGLAELHGGVEVGVRRDLVERVDDRHLRAEARERLAELEPDCAGADDEQGLRQLLELKRRDVVEPIDLVDALDWRNRGA